jgi:hypothetical protein
MSHFYGIVKGQAGEATRLGSKSSGLQTTAASWAGAVKVILWHDDRDDLDHYRAYATSWHGAGEDFEIGTGIVGCRP